MALTTAQAESRLLTATQPGHALELGYDALGRLLSEEGPLGAVLSEYRADGARTRLTHPGPRSFEMLYQNNGAIRAIHENDAAGYRLGLFHYDVENRLIDIMPNAAPGRAIQRFSYDPPSRLASIEHDLPSAGNDLTIGLGYNAAGQIATRTRSDADYVFDEPIAGETEYDRNGLNQYPGVDAPDTGAATLTYDARGNFLRYNAPGDDHERIYVYDQLNRLISARLEGESVAEATLFSYDPLGRLYQVTDQASGVSRRYLWDGDTIIAQYAGTSGTTVQRRWVYAPGSLGAPLIQYWNAQVNEASRQYVQTDERGSVVSYSNPSGALGVINTYDPYGIPASGNDGNFQYAGQLWLPEAELYYMRNRMYDPALGRFTQVDPIGFAGGMNLYAYAGNDPINAVDPFGLTLAELLDLQRITVTGDRGPPPGNSRNFGLSTAFRGFLAAASVRQGVGSNETGAEQVITPEAEGQVVTVTAPRQSPVRLAQLASPLRIPWWQIIPFPWRLPWEDDDRETRYEEEDSEDEEEDRGRICTEQYDANMETCRGRYYPGLWQEYRQCQSEAMRAYANCLSGRDDLRPFDPEIFIHPR